MGRDASAFLSAGVGFNYWSFQETNPLLANTFGPKDFSVWQMYVPVTFDYKFGAEAKMSKSLKAGYTLGVGPVLVMSAATCSDGASAINFKAAPFLKFSYGFFWHTFLSVEATALGSKFLFMDNVASRDYNQNNGYRNNIYYTVQSSSVYTIGITWMPFSFDWED